MEVRQTYHKDLSLDKLNKNANCSDSETFKIQTNSPIITSGVHSGCLFEVDVYLLSKIRDVSGFLRKKNERKLDRKIREKREKQFLCLRKCYLSCHSSSDCSL